MYIVTQLPVIIIFFSNLNILFHTFVVIFATMSIQINYVKKILKFKCSKKIENV